MPEDMNHMICESTWMCLELSEERSGRSRRKKIMPNVSGIMERLVTMMLHSSLCEHLFPHTLEPKKAQTVSVFMFPCIKTRTWDTEA